MFDCATDVQQRVENALGGQLDSELEIHEVRLVAPNKKMLCLTFTIPEAVAFAATQKQPKQADSDCHGEQGALDSPAANSVTDQQVKRQRTEL